MKKPIGEIKFNARKRLEYNYPKLLGACALVLVIGFTSVFVVYGIQTLNMDMPAAFNAVYSGDPEELNQVVDKMTTDPVYIAISHIALLIANVIIMLALAGFFKIVLNVARGGKPDLSDLFFSLKNNPDKVVVISVISYVISLAIRLPDLIAGALGQDQAAMNSSNIWRFSKLLMLIFTLAADVYLSQAVFIYLDDPDTPVKELIGGSISLIKGNVWRYILLNLSFILWYIVGAFTFGIGLIFIVPYHSMAVLVFYRDLKGELPGGQTVN
ncbi:MAG: DUF975 family protein [Lachnospiraceae bacterium]|nr:DUF975 family protein [Lachnospiraceae bacterium]